MDLKNIWLDNKRFIVAVGGGLAVFLFLGSFASGLVDDAEKLRKKSRQDRRGIIAVHKELKNSYWVEQSKVSSYEKHEAELSKALCMPVITEVEGEAENQLRVRFDQSISRLWQKLQQKSNRAGIRLPPPISPQDDFGVDPDDGPDVYRIYYSYLGVTQLGLEALIDAGVKEIQSPEIIEPEALPVGENDGEMACVYHGVSIGATGSYESFVKVLDNVQKPGQFLQARLRSLKPVSSRSKATDGDDRMLRGEIEFVGFRIVEATEDMTDRGARKKRSRSGGRSRRR